MLWLEQEFGPHSESGWAMDTWAQVAERISGSTYNIQQVSRMPKAVSLHYRRLAGLREGDSARAVAVRAASAILTPCAGDAVRGAHADLEPALAAAGVAERSDGCTRFEPRPPRASHSLHGPLTKEPSRPPWRLSRGLDSNLRSACCAWRCGLV